MAKTSTKTKAALTGGTQETFGLLLQSIRLELIRRGERLLAQRGYGITFTQFRVLRALSLVESISATELARNVEHDCGALTRVLDRLQEMGYVARRPNVSDRRAVEVFLTEQGKKAWAPMQSCVIDMNEEALSVLTEKEQKQIFALLHRVRDHLDELPDE